METILDKRLGSIRFGEIQRYKNIVVLPLLGSAGKVCYHTLGEALGASEIVYTEGPLEGAAPTLVVVHPARSQVLLLGGQELACARRNRALNTSFLLKKGYFILPASWTERGRQCKKNPSRADSGNVRREIPGRETPRDEREDEKPRRIDADRHAADREPARFLYCVGLGVGMGF